MGAIKEAVQWSPSGKATVLQDAGGRGESTVVAINDAGQSVGYSYTGRGYVAVLWSPSGKAMVLEDEGGAGISQALAVNDAGWSVGYSYTGRGPFSPTEAVL